MNELDGYRELYRLSAQVPDWRSDLGKQHRLTEVIFIMVAALIGGAQNCVDIHEFAIDGEVLPPLQNRGVSPKRAPSVTPRATREN